MENEKHEKLELFSNVPMSVICDSSLSPTEFRVLTLLISRYYCSGQKGVKDSQGWLAEQLDYKDRCTVGRAINGLEKKGYIGKGCCIGETDTIIVNLDKMKKDNQEFEFKTVEGLKRKGNPMPKADTETNPTQSDAVAETNPTETDSESEKKMKDISFPPYECSSKERVKIAAENTVEPQRAMSDTSIQRETYQEAKSEEYLLEGFGENMKERLAYLFKIMDESIASVPQRKDESLSSKTYQLAQKVFTEPSRSIVDDIEEFLIFNEDNAKHLKERIVYNITHRANIKYN